MADKRIDQLIDASSIGDSDLFVVEQTSEAKKAYGSTIANYISQKYSLSSLEDRLNSIAESLSEKQDALTFPLTLAQGGTGSNNASGAIENLGVNYEIADAFNTLRSAMFSQEVNYGSIAIGAGINPATGGNYNNRPKLARTTPMAFLEGNYIAVLNDSNYEMLIWCYSGASTSTATFSPTDGEYTADPVALIGSTVNSRYRVGFQRVDGADMTDADATAIAAGFKVYDITDKVYLPYGALADGTDLNDVSTAGSYLLSSGRTYLNSPISSNIAGLLVTFPITSFDIRYQMVFSATSARIYFRYYGFGTFREWQAFSGNYDCYLPSSGDDTDRTSDIQAMLTANGACHLGPGVFYASNIVLPEGGALRGAGIGATQLIMTSGASGSLVTMASRTSVSDLTLDGGAESVPASQGTRNGIAWQGTYNSPSDQGTHPVTGAVSNLYIRGFSGSGLLATNTSMSVNSGLNATNIRIVLCYAGVNIKIYSEFSRFSNIDVTRCTVGCIDNGGNNMFSNCSFSGCTTGLVMDNLSGQSPNSSHGSFVGCVFNHSGGDTGVAIQIMGMKNGQIFSSCQIFYGSISVETSKGIRFSSTNIGSGTPISVTNSQSVIFSDCTFNSAAQSPVTASGNTTFLFTNCYDLNGNAVTIS